MFYGGAALDRWPAQQLWAACTSPAVPVCVLAWSASFGSRLTELLLHAMWRPCGKGVKAVRLRILQCEYVFHVFQTTSQRAVFCPYSQYSGRIPHVFQNTYSKRGPKMDVFRIKFSSLREFTL